MDLEGKMIGVIKPLGITSHDVIYRLRKITGIKKIGHAGTLDPLASGILVVAIGREATKKIDQEVKKEKEYVAEVTLGAESETDDAEGPISAKDNIRVPEQDEVLRVLDGFIGTIDQVPPRFSAIKIGGKTAYRRARKGEDFPIEARKAEVKEIAEIEYYWPKVRFRIVTGPGVYIRSIARDLGRKLEVGGYLSGLERTRVGGFDLKNSLTLEEIENEVKKTG